ncbi:MAG: hypothetical protein COB33_004665 [Thiotrichaceae bacterium]|nr:hypothetical protein [Thiotrichaceae bacterium]PCI14976.1 MAG: hypothetical protein COB71_00025 [Thiotrichales bacterium]
MPDQSDMGAPERGPQEKNTLEQDLLYTNPLLGNHVSTDEVRAVLALLRHLDLSDPSLGDEGSYGLILVHEWLHRSMAYSGCGDSLVVRVER